MGPAEIILTIITSMLTGGFAVALLTYRNTNRKLEKEAKKIENEISLDNFKAQIAGFESQIQSAVALGKGYESRFAVLNDKVRTLELSDATHEEEIVALKNAAIERESRINALTEESTRKTVRITELELSNTYLKKVVKTMSGLMHRLIESTAKGLEIRESIKVEDLSGEFVVIHAQLKSELEQIKAEFEELPKIEEGS